MLRLLGNTLIYFKFPSYKAFKILGLNILDSMKRKLGNIISMSVKKILFSFNRILLILFK